MRTSGREPCRARSEHITKIENLMQPIFSLGERRPLGVANRQKAAGGFYLCGNRRGKSEDVQAFGIDHQGSRRAPRRAVNVKGMHRGTRLVACEELP